MNTIKLALQGQIYGGTDGIAYRFPRIVSNEDDWTNTKFRLLNGRGDVRDTLNPKGRPKVYAISYLQNLGFVYAVTQQNKADSRFGYADVLLLLGDRIPSDGKMMADILSELLDFFLSKEKREDNAFDQFVKDKLDELEKSLIRVGIKDNPFSVEENAKMAYRLYSDDEALYKTMRFPIQIGYKGYSKILIVPNANKPEQQTEVALVNEDVKRLITIECPSNSDVEADTKTVLEDDAFEITYKKNGFVPKKQQTKAFASKTQLYEFDEKTNVITIKSYAELGKKEPFYKQVRFVTKIEGEAEPIKESPRVFANGGPPQHDPSNGKHVVVKENGKEVTYYYYELANGNSKITLVFDDPLGKVDIKLNTEENLRQGAENCQYEGDGRYAYTVVLQPQKEVNLKVGFGRKTREGKVCVRVGSDLDEPLSFFEKEGRILVDGGGDKKNNPCIWRIVFLLFGVALGVVGSLLWPRIINGNSTKRFKEMQNTFSKESISRPDEKKYLKYAQFYDRITDDYVTYIQEVGDTLRNGTLFKNNRNMKSLYESIDSLNKMDKDVCNECFNSCIKGRQSINLQELNESVKNKIVEVDNSWFEEDKKLFVNNAQSVKISAFKSSKGKKLFMICRMPRIGMLSKEVQVHILN